MAQEKESVQELIPDPVEETGPSTLHKTVHCPVFPKLSGGEIELEVVQKGCDEVEEVAVVSPDLPAVSTGELQQVVQKGGDVRGIGFTMHPAMTDELDVVAVQKRAYDVQGVGFTEPSAGVADVLQVMQKLGGKTPVTISSPTAAATEKDTTGNASKGGQSSGSFRPTLVPKEEVAMQTGASERNSPPIKLPEEIVVAKTGKQDRRSAAIHKDKRIAPNGVQNSGSIRTRSPALGAKEEIALQNGASQLSSASPKRPGENGVVRPGGLEDRGKGRAKLSLVEKEKRALHKMAGGQEHNNVLAQLPATTEKERENVQKKEGRGVGLKVTFVEDFESCSSPPARTSSKPLNSARGSGQQQLRDDATTKGSPRNNSNPANSTKLRGPASPSPRNVVTPTKHDLKVKKQAKIPVKARVSSILSTSRESSPEIVLGYRRCTDPTNLATSKYLDSRNHGDWEEEEEEEEDFPISPLVGKSLDSPRFFSGGRYDTASKLLSESILSPNFYSKDHFPAAFHIRNQPFILGNDGSQILAADAENADAHEDKVAMLCSSMTDTNKLSGDLGKLLGTVCGKLRRPSSGSETTATTAKHTKSLCTISNHKSISKGEKKKSQITSSSTTKSSSSSTKSSLSYGLGAQKFEIGSYMSLKLLQERCSIELKDAALASKVISTHKTRDLGPHRHYYRGITMRLEQKLKS